MPSDNRQLRCPHCEDGTVFDILEVTGWQEQVSFEDANGTPVIHAAEQTHVTDHGDKIECRTCGEAFSKNKLLKPVKGSETVPPAMQDSDSPPTSPEAQFEDLFDNIESVRELEDDEQIIQSLNDIHHTLQITEQQLVEAGILDHPVCPTDEDETA